MLRYLLLGLLLAGCSSDAGTILSKDVTSEGRELLITTSKGGTFITNMSGALLSVGQEVKYSGGSLCGGGSCYAAKKDK